MSGQGLIGIADEADVFIYLQFHFPGIFDRVQGHIVVEAEDGSRSFFQGQELRHCLFGAFATEVGCRNELRVVTMLLCIHGFQVTIFALPAGLK